MRDNIYDRTYPMARLDNLFGQTEDDIYGYQKYLTTMEDVIEAMGEDKYFHAGDIFSEKSFKLMMRTYGDIETSFDDLEQGRLSSCIYLVSRYNQFLDKLGLYHKSNEELFAMNNSVSTQYLGSYANVDIESDTDEKNLGIQSKQVLNNKNLQIAIAKSNWNHPWLIMIEDWISDIINVRQEQHRSIYR